MSMLSKILAPVEFSPRCKGAVQYAEALARHFHSQIVLLHVVIPPFAKYSSIEAMAYTNAAEMAEELVEQRTAELAAFPGTDPDGVVFRRVVVEGDPALTIADFAAEENASLIVMPTHGYGPFRRFLLGSVTAKVLHDARCPVWTGPHMEQAPDYSTLDFRNVLCAVDLGLQSRQVMCWAATFARDFCAELTVVHAIPASATRLGGFYFDPDWRIELTRQAKERIDFLMSDMQITGKVRVEQGEAAVCVDEVAREIHADAVVIGRGRAGGMLGRLPTHAYAIVRQAPCPVVAI
jgi:nucleotide-binding universal stress UspA family protein